MTPYDEAIQVYLREHCTRSFAEDLEHHLRNPSGYVIRTPFGFAMGRAVDHTASVGAIIDPSISFHPSKADCWHLYLYAGKLNQVFTFCPYPLKYVSFERNNVLKIHEYEVIRRHIMKENQPATPGDMRISKGKASK